MRETVIRKFAAVITVMLITEKKVSKTEMKIKIKMKQMKEKMHFLCKLINTLTQRVQLIFIT